MKSKHVICTGDIKTYASLFIQISLITFTSSQMNADKQIWLDEAYKSLLNVNFV